MPGTRVLTRYPVTDAELDGPRSGWSWEPGTVTRQAGPGEWEIELAGGALVHRDYCEIRLASVSGFRCPCCGDDVGTPPICGDCRAAGCEQARDVAGELG